MSVVTLRQVQQERVCRETQGLGLQVLHMHVRGERGVIHHREPLIPVVSNRVPSALRHRSKLHVCQVPLCGDDEQVAEEVEVDVSERHSAAGLHTQLPHGTLTHQETAPDNQRNCLDGEGWSELVVAVTESRKIVVTLILPKSIRASRQISSSICFILLTRLSQLTTI